MPSLRMPQEPPRSSSTAHDRKGIVVAIVNVPLSTPTTSTSSTRRPAPGRRGSASFSCAWSSPPTNAPASPNPASAPPSTPIAAEVQRMRLANLELRRRHPERSPLRLAISPLPRRPPPPPSRRRIPRQPRPHRQQSRGHLLARRVPRRPLPLDARSPPPPRPEVEAAQLALLSPKTTSTSSSSPVTCRSLSPHFVAAYPRAHHQRSSLVPARIHWCASPTMPPSRAASS